jgi:hypothetical protein
MGLCQHALEQSGFSGPQKAGQDGGGYQAHASIQCVQVKKSKWGV